MGKNHQLIPSFSFFRQSEAGLLMKKTYTFANENGTFISFFDYEEEKDFEAFLAFVSRKLGIETPEINQSPYSIFAELQYVETSLTAAYGSDAGCYLRIPQQSQLSAGEIVEKCYG
jgi:hypothetical protein